MKPIAWYDPSNGVVSTDQDCPLFTPLGQVWPLCPKREWVGLDNDDLVWIYSNSDTMGQAIENTEAKLKEKNT